MPPPKHKSPGMKGTRSNSSTDNNSEYRTPDHSMDEGLTTPTRNTSTGTRTENETGTLGSTPYATPREKYSSPSVGSCPMVEDNCFEFYTPRRSLKTIVGHKISFSPLTRKTQNTNSSNNTNSSRSIERSTPPSLLSSASTSRAGSDRFIPSRVSSRLDFSIWSDDKDDNNSNRRDVDNNGMNNNYPGADDDGFSRQDGGNPSNTNQNQSQQPPLLNMLLRSELLGENIDPMRSSSNVQFVGQSSLNGNGNTTRDPLREGGSFLRYNHNHRQGYHDNVFGSVSSSRHDPTSVVDSYSLSPVRMSSNHRLMSIPQKRKRKISKVPFKVLDAPALADDFYLNLVDWSSLNVLAVGLGSCVYLWSACTSKVTKLCDLTSPSNQGGSQESATVTSVSWTQRGTHLAVGVNYGEVQLWDTVKCKKIRTMGGHSARVGALSWSGPVLASGSRDRLIYLRDMRVQQPFTARLSSHKQEVCGLKWSFDEPTHLASGGNDNKLLVWDIKNHRQPAHRFAEHNAAVKAIAWSPHQHGLLASGGGTQDRCIRFWNALSGSALNAIDTGSQVCNLAWSQNCNEIVSTHGYSLNQIALWKYPTMQKVATLTGHTYRVLYLAMSPDGSTIVTGAGDETLRFWQVFPGPRSNDKNGKNGLLFPSSPFSVLR